MRPYEVITSASQLPALAEELAQAEVIALDLETTGFSPFDCNIRLLSLNTGRGVYVVDAFQTQTLAPLVHAMRDLKGVVVGQNIKFDQKFLLYKHGLELLRVFDTYRASALIYNGKFSGRGAHDLYALYSHELGIAPEAPDLGGSDWKNPLLTKDQLDYAAEDVIHLPSLREKLKPKLASNGLNKVALIEFQAILPEAAMELNGIGFDKEAWLKLAESNAVQAEQLRKELVYELPPPSKQSSLPGFEPDFNLQSPAHVLKSLQRLGLQTMNPDKDDPEDRRKFKLGPIQSTNEIVLAGFKKDYPIIKKFLDYREYAQAVKSFGPDYLRYVNPHTGRIHSSYFPFTGAGRYACSDPNLQQVPRKKEFRACFKAAPGNTIVGADYGQIELRIAAEIADDETLMGVYRRGEDAHSQTASLVSNVPIDKVTKADRQLAKAVNFGLIYGMSANKLVMYAQSQYGVSMSLEEARKFRDRYFEAYSGVRRWHNQIFSEAHRKQGMTRTIAGRLRYLPPDAYNEFSNAPVQGSGADGLKAALATVYQSLKKYGGKARMIHMVHDEILIEASDDPELVEAVKHDLKVGMETSMQPMLKKVPVIAEAGSGASWGDAH